MACSGGQRRAGLPAVMSGDPQQATTWPCRLISSISIGQQSRGTYGALRVHAELRLGYGVTVGHNAVATTDALRARADRWPSTCRCVSPAVMSGDPQQATTWPCRLISSISIGQQSRGTYGALRVHAELRLGYGVTVGHNAVAMLMRRAGLQGLSGSRGSRRRIRTA